MPKPKFPRGYIKRDECEATMVSTAVENHTHTCNGDHDPFDGSHFCGGPDGCKRWWWERKP